MYIIKEKPEDFVVKERRELRIFREGEYAIFEMKKKNHSTVQAIQRIADKVKKPLKDFGFAGNKDRKAITTQYLSIWGGSKKYDNLNIHHITLKFLGYKKNKITLGDLDGNEFLIVVRDLDKTEVEKLNGFDKKNIPRYFGPQRFSEHNHKVGKLLLQKNFKEAIEVILEHEREYAPVMVKYLEKNKNNFIGALKKMPKPIRSLFINSYQSYLFNKTIHRFLEKGTENQDIPLLGFGTDIEDIEDQDLKKIIMDILKEEKIIIRDFIIPQLPELSLEGTTRKLFFRAEDFEIKEISDDETHKGKKAVLSFFLEKSCYATVLLSFIFEDRKNILNDLV